MKIALISLYDRGILDKERIHLRATADLDLSFFVVLDSIYVSPTGIQPWNRIGYWFSPQAVKAGANVVLYTRVGTASTEQRADGTYHFLFRNLPNPQYANLNACAVIIEVTTWITTPQAVPLPPLSIAVPPPPGLPTSLFDALNKPK